MTIIAAPLVFFPRFIHFLSDGDPADVHSDRTLSPLERLLSTHFGILLIAVAATLVLYVSASDVFFLSLYCIVTCILTEVLVHIYSLLRINLLF